MKSHVVFNNMALFPKISFSVEIASILFKAQSAPQSSSLGKSTIIQLISILLKTGFFFLSVALKLCSSFPEECVPIVINGTVRLLLTSRHTFTLSWLHLVDFYVSSKCWTRYRQFMVSHKRGRVQLLFQCRYFFPLVPKQNLNKFGSVSKIFLASEI